MKNQKGVSLIELIVVISIIGILSAIALPQYGRFIAKGRVHAAASDLLQNMRLARTMAIKENQQYLITFNDNGANSYSIGVDGDGDNSLSTAGVDTYGVNAPVRTITLPMEYGVDVMFGTTTASGPDEPDSCPACVNIAGETFAFGSTSSPVRLAFNPDGTIASTGTAFFTHAGRGFTYMVRASYQSGKFDLLKWDGDNDLPSPTVVSSCNTSPVKYCGWTELR